MRRGATFVCEGDKSAERKAVTSIRWLESRYEKAVKRLTAVPVTTRILPPAPSRAMARLVAIVVATVRARAGLAKGGAAVRGETRSLITQIGL